MALHNELGTKGELLAQDYFSKRGYTILFRNWRYYRWEIDLIASKNEILHFVEVKTRRNHRFGLPEQAVDRKKLLCMIKAGEEYVRRNPQWKRIQFNILSISILPGKEIEYFLIEDVYL